MSRRSVESSDWPFVCLQISRLKSENYHVDFNCSVSKRLAWIGSPLICRPIFLLLHVLLLTENGLTTALRFLVSNPYTRIGTIMANGHPRVFVGNNVYLAGLGRVTRSNRRLSKLVSIFVLGFVEEMYMPLHP